MQNLALFWTISKFDGEYFWERYRYLKLEKYSIDSDSSHVRRKKFGELWSNSEIVSTQINFFGRPYFGHWGVLHPQIFTRTREWPCFTSAPLIWDGGFLTFFYNRWSKMGV